MEPETCEVFHCESSAVTIVYTSVLESQVSYRYSWVESFSSLDQDQFCDLRPEFFKRRWFGPDERSWYSLSSLWRFKNLFHQAPLRGSSTWDTTRVSFDSCTNRHRSSLPRFKPMCSVSTPARNSVKSRLAVRMPFIAPCSLQIHPSRSCPFGVGRKFHRMSLLA